MQRRPAVAVGLDEEQIPGRAERVHLELVVLVRVAVRIEEDLEVVVLEDDGVALGDRRPDVGFVELRRDVQRLVIPEQLHARGVAHRPDAVDVDEGRRPCGGLPGGFVEPAVDGQR